MKKAGSLFAVAWRPPSATVSIRLRASGMFNNYPMPAVEEVFVEGTSAASSTKLVIVPQHLS